MTLPTLDRYALDLAQRGPGTTVGGMTARDLPAWCTAHLTYDVDGVLTLDVRAHRPGRDPSDVHRHLCDQLSELGWSGLQHGPLPHTTRDGLQLVGVWSTWARRGDK